jgi:mono/diheme cytochrome c family protein
MKIYNGLALLSLTILVLLLPLYALQESDRMARADALLEAQYVADAAALYLTNCASCHGTDGLGLGAMPALNKLALAEANYDVLYRTIAYSPHGSAMGAWHVEEGGTLNSYQVKGLVTLIRTSAWEQVSFLAQSMDVTLEPIQTVALADLEPADNGDPHECRACHEEPVIHAERFGLNCARCHGLQAWKPALLTKHTFPLDHGGDQLACQTCHVTTYASYTCYGCHDHEPTAMEAVHFETEPAELEACAACHPTGEPAVEVGLQAMTPSPHGTGEDGDN